MSTSMKRLAATGIALCAGVGLMGGVASAQAKPGGLLTPRVDSGSATPALAVPAGHVKKGSQWTLEVNAGGCIVQTFGKDHTWTSDFQGDSGTYAGGGKTISETFTAGSANGLTFAGTYSKHSKEYTGTFGGPGAGNTGQLVKGVVSSWNGFSC